MRFTFEIDIDAPRERVFDFLADPVNRPRWQSSIQSFSMEPQGELGIGIRWQESVRGPGTFEMEISEFQRPSRWAERLRARAFEGTVAMTFADSGDATRLRVDADVRCKGLWRLVDPIGCRVLRREMRKDLSRVASLLPPEGSATVEQA